MSLPCVSQPLPPRFPSISRLSTTRLLTDKIIIWTTNSLKQPMTKPFASSAHGHKLVCLFSVISAESIRKKKKKKNGGIQIKYQ